MSRTARDRRPYLRSPRCILRLKTVRLAMYPDDHDFPTVEIIPRETIGEGERSVYRLYTVRSIAQWEHVQGPDIDDDLIWELVWAVHQSYAQSEYIIRSANREQELAG